jgi:hypothetical protein
VLPLHYLNPFIIVSLSLIVPFNLSTLEFSPSSDELRLLTILDMIHDLGWKEGDIFSKLEWRIITI